ncbi:MAG TPA: DUF3429 domain-containing protein [Steroidobacteraceae bacterium]|nr:DUF3429 domain-containing protein [Steroidobacteraceae bacterium]
MAISEHSAGPARLGSTAEWLGYAAIAPFVLCLAGVGLLPSHAQQEMAQRVAIAWGAVLLAASAAVHWGLALAGRLPRGPRQLLAAVLPPLTAAGAVLIGGQRALALLVVGFGGFWLYEHRALGVALPSGYLLLRRSLTLAICMLLALTMFASDSAGLR